MKKLMTYLFFISLAFGCSQTVYASTDLLSNAMTQSNNFLKEAGLVQKKYSGIAREYVTSKTGDVNNLAGERAKKYKAKAESLKKKTEKIQKWAKKAQEKKAELEDKYTKLNEKAMKYKEKADKALAEGRSITESYKKVKSDATDFVNDAKNMKDMAEGLKDQTLGDIKDAASTVKEAASRGGDSDEPTESVSVLVENEKNTNVKAEEKLFRQPLQKQTNVVQDIVSVSQPTVTQQAVSGNALFKVQQPNKADAIRSAAVLADQSMATETTEQFIPMQMSEMPAVENAVSAADIMVAAEKMPMTTIADEQYSKLNIEEQLMMSSNKAVKVQQSRTTSAKMISDKKTVEPQKRSTLRRLFDAVTGKDDVAEKITEDASEQRSVPLQQSEKSSTNFQLKEKVND